ncbi:MAG: DUF499 domain-containing protein, partial [Myxococcota bacterium]
MEETQCTQAPRAKRAVLVGTALSPGEVSLKQDGTRVHTIWGEMAWQLGGAKGYKLVEKSDKLGTSPGSEVLTRLFKQCGTCLILIDEWVAYARQLFHKQNLPSGDFEAQSSFAQAITEAAKACPRVLVVASIPASKIEIGGEHGEQALEVLKNIFTRVAKPWRPATGDEGFEIVRRRLFEPIEQESLTERDKVVSAFSKMYREQNQDFPRECKESDYRSLMTASYPIHPELFRRLYDDWSTLDKFQRTRGVLRLLAKVIHRLWEGQDNTLMILPSSIPMDDHSVKSEMTRYLEEIWEPIISQDVDGPNSMPLELDRHVPNLGRYSACRRVARALYVGTAPGAKAQHRGLGEQRIRLACTQPGESPSTFGDALRRVSDRGRYIHQDANQYWLSTKPNLNRNASERAAEKLREPEYLYDEIERRLSEAMRRQKSPFHGIHLCPRTSSDIPDDENIRLVILGPQYFYQSRPIAETEPTLHFVNEIVEKRGEVPRINRNVLFFLAPERKERKPLLEKTAHYLAWQSIQDDKEALNLDAYQEKQTRTKLKELENTIEMMIANTWTRG